MRLNRVLALLALLVFTIEVAADELIMKNGSRLVGTLISAEADVVTFETPFAGTISVKEENISRVVTASPVTIQLQDGQVLYNRTIDDSEGQLIASGAGEPDIVFATSDIKLINPKPWKLGNGYNWTGDASVALDKERGNSDTDELDIAAKTEWRSLTDRYTIRYLQEIDKTEGTKTTDNWNARFKYDRFLASNPANYWGIKAWFEYDKFQDLDLRTTVGPHIGRQFFDNGILSLRGELGPVYVDEKYDVAEDNDYFGALWDFEATSNILGFGTTLYAEQDGVLNFEESDSVLLNIRLGIKMPLIFGFQTGIETLWEYDGGAVEGVDKWDQTYMFRVGYAW